MTITVKVRARISPRNSHTHTLLPGSTVTSYVLALFLGEKYVSKRMTRETFQSLASEWNRKGYVLCVVFSQVPVFPVDLLALVCGMLKTKPLLFFTYLGQR